MIVNDQKIDALIDDLAQAQLAADACNQYAPQDANNATRRANLRLYLRTMARRRPKLLLVMEAPGYRGCRVTGIPVTSRKIMLRGLPALDIFGERAGYRDVNEAGFERIQGEQSATIVWNALADMNALPMIWNAFPFHPHKFGQPLSNRKPRAGELELGALFLRRILDLWRFDQVAAVGNVAQANLNALGIDCPKLRHPAQGGKHEFISGLRALLSVRA